MRVFLARNISRENYDMNASFAASSLKMFSNFLKTLSDANFVSYNYHNIYKYVKRINMKAYKNNKCSQREFFFNLS